MAQALDILTIVLIIVVLARIAGELLSRKKQSPIIGEVLVGLLLGPYVLKLVDPSRDVFLMAEINGIAQLGMFFLIFHAGLEFSLKELGTSLRTSFPVIFGGLALPFSVSTVILLFARFGPFADITPQTAIFIGLCLSLTALPVSVRVLSDLGKLHTQSGRTILSTAIGNDVGALVMLAILLNISATGTARYLDIIIAILKVTFFIGLLYLISKLLEMTKSVGGKDVPAMQYYTDRMVNALHSKESVFAVAILFVLAFGGLAVVLGLHFVIGAFFGAVIVSRDLFGKRNFKKVGGVISAVAMGFIAPIFFVYIGLSFYVQNYELLYYIPVFIAIYIGTKLLGGYLGARAMKFSRAYSGVVAVGIANPGTMEIIIASLGLDAGLINPSQFSLIVLMVMVVMIIGPVALKRAFDRAEAKEGARKDRSLRSEKAKGYTKEVITVQTHGELPPIKHKKAR
jgi:Kef-type K+ transport system membrane component KefB